MRTIRSLVLVVLAALFLTACAVNPPQADLDELSALYPDSGLTHIPELEPVPIEGELSLDQAVAHALWHNPRMREIMAEFDVVAADVIAASEFANPRLSAGIFFPESGGSNEYDLGLSWGISGLLLRSSRQSIAEAHWQEKRLQLAARITALIEETQQAYFDAIAQQQHYSLQQKRRDSAELSATLAARFYDAGNLTRLDLEQARIDAAEQKAALRQKQYERDHAQITLFGMMGLNAGQWDSVEWHLPASLPEPVILQTGPDDLVSEALAHRLDLRALDYAAQGMTQAVALTERYRWLGDVQPGLGYERKHSGTRLYGASLSIALPVFNQNQSGIARSEARVRQVSAARAHLIAAIEQDIHAQYAQTQSLAERFLIHQDLLAPAHQQVVAEKNAQVNFMLDDVFSLFAPRHAQIHHWQMQAQLLSDYWQSHLHLRSLAGQTRLPDMLHEQPRFTPSAASPMRRHADSENDNQHHEEPDRGHAHQH